MKKIILGILCISTVIACGCNNSESSGDSSSESTVSSEKNSSEKSSNLNFEEQIEELQKQVKDMREFISVGFDVDIDEINGDYEGNFNYLSQIHDIYDDTEVVKAYLSDDSSALTDEKDIFILEKASEVIDEIIKDNMSDYEKEKAVFDWIFHNTKYDEGRLSAIPEEGEFSHTPYGVLKYGDSICVGNATTFKLFMDMLKIECKIIHSTESGEHAWNLVKIDGDWYHTDITLDYGTSTPDYTYLNVPDRVKIEGGYLWDEDDYPEATAIKYCYLYQNSVKADDVYALPIIISRAIKDNKNTVTVIIEAENQYELDYWANDAVIRISELINNPDLYMEYQMPIDDNTTILTIRLTPYEDEEYPEDPEDMPQLDYQALDKAIQNAFPNL